MKDGSPHPRLADDDLYTWARLVSDLEHAQAALNRFGKDILVRAGLDPRLTSITNEGYILENRSDLGRDLIEAARNGAD